MIRGGILAFDLATQTGWAHSSGPAIKAWPDDLPGKHGPIDGVNYGSFSCGKPGTIPADKWLEMHEMVHSLLADFQPELVVFEAPIPVIKGRAVGTVRLLVGFAVIVEMLARTHHARCLEEHPNSVKKWATGSGRAEKHEMVAAAEARGWAPANDDEADALMLLDMTVFAKVL